MTFNGKMVAIAAFWFVPFIFVPLLIFQFETQWIRHEPAAVAVIRTRWIGHRHGMRGHRTRACLDEPAVDHRLATWPPRPMTTQETERAIAAIGTWDKGDRGDLSVLLAQLTWRWLPNPRVNSALSQKVRVECGASGTFEFCFEGLRTLLTDREVGTLAVDALDARMHVSGGAEHFSR